MILDAATIDELVAAYDRIPPFSKITANRIVWYDSPYWPKTIYAAFFKGGCEVGSAPLAEPFFRQFIPAVYHLET